MVQLNATVCSGIDAAQSCLVEGSALALFELECDIFKIYTGIVSFVF